MAFFKKLLGKETKSPRGFSKLKVAKIRHLCGNTAEITFEIPEDLKGDYRFVPGQYVNLDLEIKGQKARRSYSICSAPNEAFRIAAKTIEHGLVSNYLYHDLEEGDELLVSTPEGRFKVPDGAKNIVAIAAGSGITPILSIVKAFSASGSIKLLYASRKEDQILFRQEIDALGTDVTYFLSQEDKPGFRHGRIDNDSLSSLIKEDLNLLKADAFLICGPEEMIVAAKEILSMFGVANDKIIFELFTTPTKMDSEKKSEESAFHGSCKLTLILEGEEESCTINGTTTILDAALSEGMDAPYSCRGGVCSSCKGKVLEGKVSMRLNYVLTDKEISEGYVLTCQSVPASETVKLSYDA